MAIAIILGAAKEPMEERLLKALYYRPQDIIITGRTNDDSLDSKVMDDELSCLDHILCRLNTGAYYIEAHSTFGSYYKVCKATNKNDDLIFFGHESHTHRMAAYKDHFKKKSIINIIIPDPNLKLKYRRFDQISANIHKLALKYTPNIFISQVENPDSILNRYIIPIKNRLVN